ncbi:hypothetical protein D3C81_475800 [compost metagenome]
MTIDNLERAIGKSNYFPLVDYSRRATGPRSLVPRSFSAWPRLYSALPKPYIGAVSEWRIPPSSAALTIARACS